MKTIKIKRMRKDLYEVTKLNGDDVYLMRAAIDAKLCLLKEKIMENVNREENER